MSRGRTLVHRGVQASPWATFSIGVAVTCGAVLSAVEWRIGAGVAGAVLVFASATALVVARQKLFASVRNRERWACLGSAIFAGGILLAVVLPGLALVAGTRESRLTDLGFVVHDVDGSVSRAFLIFLLALCSFSLGEALARSIGRARSGQLLRIRLDGPSVYVVLMIVGLTAYLLRLRMGASTEEVLAQRGHVQGQGAASLAQWAIPLAVTIGILNRHWRSRWLALLSSLAFLGVVLFAGVRSPLVLIAIAVLMRLLVQGAQNRRALRTGVLIMAILYTGALMAIALSAWRGKVTRGQDAALSAEITKLPANPFDKLASQAGLDTVDGLILAVQVDREAVGARWSDPANAVTGFVPRKVWPEKPDWLGSMVTKHYLDWGGHAGMFLSGPGYAYVVFAGAAGVAGVFLALGLFAESLYARIRPLSAEAALLTYFLLRFFFGGDAFDAFHVLSLFALLLAARGIARIAVGLMRGSPPGFEPRLEGGI